MKVNEWVERGERAEAELYHQLLSKAPGNCPLGVSTARMAGGVVTSVRQDVSGYWSNALAFGLDEPITGPLFDQIIDFYTAQRNPSARILIPPAVSPAEWAAIRDRHALRACQARFQHICDIKDVRCVGSTDLRVGAAPDVEQWTRFTMRVLGMSDGEIADMLIPGYGSNEFQLFSAWDEDRMVAGAALFVWQDVAVLNSGATLATHRNRGAQSALIAARVAAARTAGCRWVVTQTADPGSDGYAPSLNNMIRVGLVPLYARPVWNWGTPEAVL
ncbi:hypothetical protein KL953_34600 [Mycolicibacterium goodii]|uniref:hypothetical protein n=1 Tax=Mycolicibacterium goodii TaxID=134601 RepID=UPI001BDC011A|nr:hypothetical protein [Mycolicibacterium goodii]MBU8813995.1 hypothetical protein [Mycolicibacterium goodii]ULN49512.1 hypothetical protein MI170_09295 [Mycolicibacterium goodii]